MTLQSAGIHHVTAIAHDAQRQLDFWTGPLGLRLVKLTLNFDSGDAYHLFFGDRAGTPGSIHTVFPYPTARTGRPGAGQFVEAAFAVPVAALDHWTKRLTRLGVAVEGPAQRFGQTMVRFTDPDGIRFELVASAGAGSDLLGFDSVALRSRESEQTSQFLTEVLGFRPADEEPGRLRYLTGAGGSGARLDLLDEPAPRALGGAGTIHHVAWRAADVAELNAWRERLLAHGLAVTEVKDRRYFQSIYVREPGGVLFELATDGPGFTVDEPLDQLGSRLLLPPGYESSRDEIARHLAPLRLPSSARVPGDA